MKPGLPGRARVDQNFFGLKVLKFFLKKGQKMARMVLGRLPVPNFGCKIPTQLGLVVFAVFRFSGTSWV